MKYSAPNAAESSSIALKFIEFIASNEERLERFLALSGISLQDIKSGIANPEFQGFILDYALQDEVLIIEFSTESKIRPETIQLARFSLPGATYDT